MFYIHFPTTYMRTLSLKLEHITCSFKNGFSSYKKTDFFYWLKLFLQKCDTK
jgi:hypothetical protein